MLKLINTSTAYYGSGLSLQKRLFKLRSGPYAGRMAAIFPLSPATIALAYADPPYLSWSTPLNVVTDSADFPCGCWMDSVGNIYMAYTVQSSLNLAIKKLTLGSGSWSVGSENIIYNADSNYYPSLFKDIYNRLWVSWTRFSGGSYYINVKSSTSDGSTWGLGPSDAGTSLTSGSNSAFSQLVYLPTYLYCIYTNGTTKLAYRRFELAGAVWYSESEIFNGTGLSDNFHAAISSDLKIGVTFMAGSNLYFKDFDGAAWSGNFALDSAVSVAPVLLYNGSLPFVFYGKELGLSQDQLYYAYRSGTGFSIPARMTAELAAFDKVLCFSSSAIVKYADKSAAAANDTAADVFHPETNKLMLSSGDALLMGQSEKFHHMRITLSAAGSGGTVAWHYWDGSNWKSFTPFSGEYNFDSSPALVRLWEDSWGLPSDWQSSVINGFARFWIKAQVTAAFGAGPVGSQITAGAELPYITVL